MFEKIKENPTFLRYHEIWRNNPSSIVFAPLAEMLILHKCYEEAITICKKGLEKNPEFVSGRVALARAYVGVANFRRALSEAQIVLNRIPGQAEAAEIVKVCNNRLNRAGKAFFPPPPAKIEEEFVPSELDPSNDVRWNTITMAEIFASQGDLEKARVIYEKVLAREPDNPRAQKGLTKLRGIDAQ